MKKTLFMIGIITLCLFLYTMRYSEDTIVVCSSSEQFRNDWLQHALNERFPQYHIVVMYMPTGKAATKVMVEGTQTDIDILVGLETGYLMKIKENLADIEGLSKLEYLEELTPDKSGNKWVTWERFAGAIVVNPKVIEKYHLDMPQTYDDLLDAQYENLIAMPDPKSSGTGYFFYKNWVNTRGEEEALTYVDKLAKNLKQFTESGSGPINMAIQGEVAIGLGMTFQAVNEINKGSSLEIIYPPEGSPYSLTGTGIIQGKKEKSGVLEVYEYIINECLLYDKENFSPEKVLEQQKNNIENYPSDIEYADMEGISDPNEKERLLALWNY